jgi:hypothetical protein
MDRRHFLLTSLAGALAAPLDAGAQQAVKVWRIGYLFAGACPRTSPSKVRSAKGSTTLGTSRVAPS